MLHTFRRLDRVSPCRHLGVGRWRLSVGRWSVIKAIFFDAVGTLFYLTRTVGDHYALVGSEMGLTLDAKQLDRAFYTAWKQMPRRAAIEGRRNPSRHRRRL